ncbi:hypothetical protein ECE50_023315 [Chitinophaga sp. Mgbs1]|uniref:Uncharacterized protein n=1 Tax=Chitinophaga solisilvae TaxID=1233460 RepID=A0A433WBB2_9BACT|nr:hypothetical protein [Chitinophaga solisilvae]
MFDGKKILFISPLFFGYEKDIKEKLESLGAEVDFYDERPSNTVFSKALLRISKNFVRSAIKQHYHQIFEQVKDKTYDYFFLIKGEATPAAFLQQLRDVFKHTAFIYYSYDSIANNINAKSNLEFFDKKYSFDDQDVSVIPELEFRALFYLDEYVQHGEPADFKYDVSFIGTVHSDRYQTVKKLLEEIRVKVPTALRTYLFFYCQSQLYYYFRRLMDKNFKGVRKADISFLPMAKRDIFRVFKESQCIIDIHHPFQTGLTMRTIEAVGAKKKIITTNERIRKYDFYSPDNILIIDRKQPLIEASFFSKPYQPLAADIYNKYSLDSWLAALFRDA